MKTKLHQVTEVVFRKADGQLSRYQAAEIAEKILAASANVKAAKSRAGQPYRVGGTVCW